MDEQAILSRIARLNFEEVEALYWFCHFERNRGDDNRIGEQIPNPKKPGEGVSGGTARGRYREALSYLRGFDERDICSVVTGVFGYPPDWSKWPIAPDDGLPAQPVPTDQPEPSSLETPPTGWRDLAPREISPLLLIFGVIFLIGTVLLILALLGDNPFDTVLEIPTRPTEIVEATNPPVPTEIPLTPEPIATTPVPPVDVAGTAIVFAAQTQEVLPTNPPQSINTARPTVPTSTSTDEPVLPSSTPPPISATLDQGLVAYYPFNNDANDHSGNGHDGVVVGATLSTDRSDNPNSAYQFDGLDDYILVSDSPEFRAGLRSLTITLWFNLARQEGHNPLINKFLDGASKDWGIRIIDGKYSFGTENGTGIFADYGCGQDVSSIQPFQWYFAAVVMSEPTVSLYLDGSPYAVCNDFIDRWVPTEADVEIGRIGYIPAYFRGSIDEVRIYDRALNEQEIAELYNTVSP